MDVSRRRSRAGALGGGRRRLATHAAPTIGSVGKTRPRLGAAGGNPAAREAHGQQPSSPRNGGPSPIPDGGHNQGVKPAGSTTTSQTLWQLQIAGCHDHCQDTGQRQIAQQQNLTEQAAAIRPQTASATSTLPGRSGASQSQPTVTQIQLGCLAHCFGQTTTSTGLAGNALHTVQRLISKWPLTTPAVLDPAPAAQLTVVEQFGYQLQKDAGAAVTQHQTATQTNATTRRLDRLAPELQGTLPGMAGKAVNQVQQGIWQLQIGCISFCRQTSQYQQAQQSDTTTRVFVQTPGSPARSAATALVKASQVIRQLQVGCLFWCYDAIHGQVATSQQNQTVLTVPPPSPRAPPVLVTPPPSPPAPSAPTATPAGPGALQTGQPAAGSPRRPTNSAAGIAIASGETGARTHRAPADNSPATAVPLLGVPGLTRTGAGTPPPRSLPGPPAQTRRVRTSRPSINSARGRSTRPAPASTPTQARQARPAGPDPATWLLLLVALVLLVALIAVSIRSRPRRLPRL